MFDYSYYTGKDLVYPTRPPKPTMPMSDNPDNLRDYADRLESYQKEKEKYINALQVYNETMVERKNELNNKLMDEYDLNSDAFNIIWNKAYNDYHSGGLEEVIQEFENLYDFVMEFNKFE